MGSINLYKIDNEKVSDFLTEVGRYNVRDTKYSEFVIDSKKMLYEFQLFIADSQTKKPVSWNWVMDAFEEEGFEIDKNPGALLRVKSPSGNTYAVSFAHTFFLADKYCDREFAFEFARRLTFDGIRTTALTSPNSKKNRTVNSYVDYTSIEFDSGESFSKIKIFEKQPAGFSLYARTLEIGNSIKFSVEKDSLETVAGLIEYVEKTILNAPEINKIPVFTRVKNPSKIDRLNDWLKDTASTDPTKIVIPEFDIIGANEIFNRTDSEFDLLYHYKKEHITNLSVEELEKFCNKYGLIYNDCVLDIVVASYKDGKIVVKKKIRELIEITNDDENAVLSKGIWYDFNSDYLKYLDDSISEIAVEYHPEYDFTIEGYQNFIDKKYQEEASVTQGDTEEARKKKLKDKYYAERAFNILRAENDGFDNYDRELNSVGGSNIEVMDLYRDKKIFAVKIGNASSKLCYAVDQSLTAIKAYRNHAIAVDAPFDTVVLWFVLGKSKHIEDRHGKPDITKLKMLMLKNRLDEWKKEIRLQGLNPLIYINYDQR